MLRAAAVVAALTIVAAAALVGQTPDEQAKLDRLTRRYDDLTARLTNEAEVGVPRVDSVHVGGLWILSDSAESPVLLGAVESFRRLLMQQLGPAPLPLLAGARIAVRFGEPHPGWGHLVTGDTQFIGVQQRRRTSEWLTGQLAQAVSGLLAQRGGASMAAWRGDVRLFQDQGPLLEATHLELLTANAPGAEGCRDGSLEACARSLNLIARLPGQSVEANAELRRFVERRLRHRASEPALAPAYSACVDGGDAAACLAFLERAGVQEPTLSTRATGTLLVAIGDVGGPDALARFFADTGAAIVPRLEAAAGMPVDSLLARWRETILAHRPPPTAVPAGMQWFVLGWATVLVALATRSTRWR
jgi:hypothetical protein